MDLSRGYLDDDSNPGVNRTIRLTLCIGKIYIYLCIFIDYDRRNIVSGFQCVSFHITISMMIGMGLYIGLHYLRKCRCDPRVRAVSPAAVPQFIAVTIGYHNYLLVVQSTTQDQGYGRGGTPVFTGVFEPVARVTLYFSNENGLDSCFGAA